MEQVEQKNFASEARFTFLESVGVLVGHSIGAGILSVPYFASLNNWWDFLWIIAFCFFVNVLLHLMIAELSYNNGGQQFVKCIQNTLLKGDGKAKKIIGWVVLVFLGLSVVMNVCAYISGSADAILSIIGIDAALENYEGIRKLVMVCYYGVSALVVFFGMKIVGISEKYSSFAMILVMGLLAGVSFFTPNHAGGLTADANSWKAMMALYGMISFALSAVMSVPTVVKGLNGDVKKIRLSVVTSVGISTMLIIMLTFATMIGSGSIDKRGATINLSESLYNWIKYIGLAFTLIALSTSFWANSLNLRDMLSEQTGLNKRFSWLITSLPCLLLAVFLSAQLVSFSTFASAIQVVTNIAIIVAYGLSRRKAKESPICGFFGKLPFEILVVLMGIIATIGSLLGSGL